MALLLGAGVAQAQETLPGLDAPRLEGMRAQIDRCRPGGPGAPAARELDLTLSDIVPFSQAILARHDLRPSLRRENGQWRLVLNLGPVRRLAQPSGNPETVYLSGDARLALEDRRSRFRDLSPLDEASVVAADLAYDVRDEAPDGTPGAWLDTAKLAQELPGYRLVRLYTDSFTGFSAAALESRPEKGTPHRLYAVAGTHVFAHLDFRTWASGLTLARAQFTSNAALSMIADMADYVSDLRTGGEALVTGQSQGGLTAQGIGYLLQSYLDGRGGPHHLVHVVSWGGAGGQEVLARMIAAERDEGSRGFRQSLEQHWALTEPDYPRAMGVWQAVSAEWARIPPGREAASIQATMGHARVVGYFFEIDLFARVGTFPGRMMAFPTALILPEACEMTVVEARLGLSVEPLGVRLESHFLDGYRRAVGRGALGIARPALPAKWPWLLRLLPALERVGYLWLDTLYFEGAAAEPENWRRCVAAGHWFTPKNASCSQSWWTGCSPPPGETLWCLASPP
ncbi:hypothetical protein IAI18_20035 [Acetobacteraceae bacterium H6797]|nr:hypothetical protein [Acetobacteraceae bacterium H6797]